MLELQGSPITQTLSRLLPVRDISSVLGHVSPSACTSDINSKPARVLPPVAAVSGRRVDDANLGKLSQPTDCLQAKQTGPGQRAQSKLPVQLAFWVGQQGHSILLVESGPA